MWWCETSEGEGSWTEEAALTFGLVQACGRAGPGALCDRVHGEALVAAAQIGALAGGAERRGNAQMGPDKRPDTAPENRDGRRRHHAVAIKWSA